MEYPVNKITKNKNLVNNMDDSLSTFINSNGKIPQTYGLNNYERTIGQHYFVSDKKNKEIDMFYELTKNIRNFKPLDSNQLNYVTNLPKDKILELIQIYNTCFHSVNQIFEKI